MSRKPLIAGNWKMNLNHLESIQVLQKFAFAFPSEYYDDVDVAFMVPFTDIRSVQTVVEGDKLQFTYGAQDISTHDSGAYTGEISGEMLEKLQAQWVVVGHSERREYHDESNEDVASKALQTLKYSMTPIVCVGEPLDIREAGTHVDYVLDQTRESLAGLSAEDISKTVIAYEPVWAIGTGKVASSADAQEVCKAIRGQIAQLASIEIANSVRILYGGSIKTDSIADLMAQPDVDGGLVGGASLDGEDFARLCAGAAQAVSQ